MPWYVINTHPKKEFLALANISRQGFETFLPTFIHKYPRIGERLRPLFPSYLFVEFDPDSDRWFPLCHTLGVKRLFSSIPDGNYVRPTPIATELIDSLKARVLETPKKTVAPVISPGTAVRITKGHFEGRTGICSWSNTKRVALLLDVLNGRLEISFSRDTVELLEET